MSFPQGQEIMKAESQQESGRAAHEGLCELGLSDAQDQTGPEAFGQQWAWNTAESTGRMSGWVESRLSEVLQAEKSWALTVESFQVSWNGLYAVGNEVGLNTVSGGSTQQAGRGEAWTDFRLWD